MGLQLLEEEQKKCSKCFEMKFLYEFHKDKGQASGKRPDCRDCQKEYHLANKEHRNAQCRNYNKVNNIVLKEYYKNKYAKNKIKYNNARIKNMYGITLEDYTKMFEEQCGSCAICKRSQNEFKKALHIDHCHTTGKVRGLLCHNCNTFIGHAKENISILSNGISYLKKAEEV